MSVGAGGCQPQQKRWDSVRHGGRRRRAASREHLGKKTRQPPRTTTLNIFDHTSSVGAEALVVSVGVVGRRSKQKRQHGVLHGGERHWAAARGYTGVQAPPTAAHRHASRLCPRVKRAHAKALIMLVGVGLRRRKRRRRHGVWHGGVVVNRYKM